MDMTAEQLHIEEVVRTFEVYTSRYSKIVQAHGIVDALQKFLNENGGEKVICIEDVNYAFIKTKELEKQLQKESMKQLSLLDQIKELEEIIKNQTNKSELADELIKSLEDENKSLKDNLSEASVLLRNGIPVWDNDSKEFEIWNERSYHLLEKVNQH